MIHPDKLFNGFRFSAFSSSGYQRDSLFMVHFNIDTVKIRQPYQEVVDRIIFRFSECFSVQKFDK